MRVCFLGGERKGVGGGEPLLGARQTDRRRQNKPHAPPAEGVAARASTSNGKVGESVPEAAEKVSQPEAQADSRWPQALGYWRGILCDQLKVRRH